MRTHASFVALFLSGLTGVHSFNWNNSWNNSTNATNGTISSSNSQVISQLQKEILELQQKLAEAGSTCDSDAGNGANGASGGNGVKNSATISDTASVDISTYVTTVTNQYTTVVNTVYITKTVSPYHITKTLSPVASYAADASDDGSQDVSHAGASIAGASNADASHAGASHAGVSSAGASHADASNSNGGAGSASASSAHQEYPDYYAPHAPASTSTATSTVTVIVTPGHSAPAQSGLTSNNGVHTCTETYVGSGSVPSQPAPTSSSASSVVTSSGSISSSAPYGFHNGTSTGYPTGSSVLSGFVSRVATATSGLSSAVPSATKNLTDCSSLCSTLTKFNDWDVTVETCTQLKAGVQVQTPSGQSSVGCAASFTPAIDVCQVTLNVKTAGNANTYMEVWLPNGNSSSWNGRTMSTDNGGLNGCVHYVDMQYVSGMGFAAIGDNAGHNGSSFDGTWTMDNNEAIVDWAWRARHASADVGKQLVNLFYSKKPEYSYYIGCSTGGAQGMQSAQKFPNDFDGIISGSSAADFNHLQDWSAHFRQITGAEGNDTFLSLAEWTLVQSYVLAQCDEPIDHVADGILEDPTLCDFDVSAIPVCNDTTTSNCLTPTQIDTVEQVFKPLYNGANLIYPALLYGAQVDAFRLGLLSGSIQGIAQDFYRGGVYNDSSFDILNIGPKDWNRADQLDGLHGNPSAFSGDLSAFSAAGKKMIMYHGMADPMTSGTNSQRYYQKVAATMGLDNTEIDEFMRFFRISGMAHCGVGGISGAGAWMFGQSLAASSATNNIVTNLVDWVEKGGAPDSLLGTKFWYDTPSMGIEFQRRHCRYPYRTTYKGGDSTQPESWGCDFIEDWQECEGVTCNADGTFA